MTIGELKHRITLQTLEAIVNENGFEEEQWIDFKTLWASIKNLHGREYFQAATVQKENTVKFIIRYLPGIDTSMKILFKDKHYNITSIDNIRYENRFIEIKALEVDSLG
ncbi:phage head closure protein [Tissierella creatinophila]|uniref:Phage head-tail joining protein n=1 Tax=Tissierella creatinophila DSM 6911 TaxID=1123403 RepID=A0A1U7M5J5_TISCR|nr:phage head closure protein [Tissierella creatinophila]OLS02556.1 phage head-tail joining protein [Tissierella creatinophila DSM 6911]